MSTEPIPTPSIFNFTADWTFILQHIILLLIAAGLIFGSVYGVESLLSKHDAAVESKYTQILATQTAQTLSLEKQVSTDESNWSQQQAQVVAQLQTDQKTMANKDAQITAIIGKINTYQPPQIVADLQPKLHAGIATILTDGIKLDTAAARDVDTQITQGTAAEADLVTTKTDLNSEIDLNSKVKQGITDVNNALTAEQKKNADQVQSCNNQITTLKHEAIKGKIKWFFIGYVSGFISKTLIK